MEVPEIDLGNGVKGVDWHPFAEGLKSDPEVAPHLDKISEKDVGSVLKSYVHLQKKLGSAINLPGKDAKPEDIIALKQKLYGAGVFTAPPERPEGYEFKKPDILPPRVVWKEEWVPKAQAVFHKLGLNAEQAAGIVTLHGEMMAEMGGGQMADEATVVAALKTKWGAEFDSRSELAGRATAELFSKNPKAKEFFDRTGLGNDPDFIEIMEWIGQHRAEDSAFIQAGGVDGVAVSDAEKEASDIIQNKDNPKYKLYWGGDKATREYVEGLFAKVYPGDVSI